MDNSYTHWRMPADLPTICPGIPKESMVVVAGSSHRMCSYQITKLITGLRFAVKAIRSENRKATVQPNTKHPSLFSITLAGFLQDLCRKSNNSILPAIAANLREYFH